MVKTSRNTTLQEITSLNCDTVTTRLLTLGDGQAPAMIVNNSLSDTRSYGRFSYGPADFLFSVMQPIPIAFLPGQGQGGPYDPGNNLIGFPSTGVYRFTFTCEGDTDLTFRNTVLFQWVRSGPTPGTLSMGYHPFGGNASKPTKTQTWTFIVNNIADRFRLEGQHTDVVVTNFRITGEIVRIVSFS